MSEAELQKVMEAEHRFCDSKEYFLYLAEEKKIRDEMARLAYAEKKGLSKGQNKGRADEHTDMIISMLRNNLPLQTIISISGDSEADILKLKTENKL